MDNGSEVDLIESPLDEAQLKFQSSHSDLVDIDENGQLTLLEDVQDVRSFEVWADVSLNNKTVKSNILKLDITVSIPLIRFTLDYFKDNDAIQTPLYKQLSNRLDQAEHHQKNGRTKQAIKHLEDFQKHLHNKGMQKFISAEAKEVLDKDVQVIISSW